MSQNRLLIIRLTMSSIKEKASVTPTYLPFSLLISRMRF